MTGASLLAVLLVCSPGWLLQLASAQAAPELFTHPSSIVQPAQSGSIFDYCPATVPERYPFPVRTSSFCDTVGLAVPNNTEACNAFNMLEALLVTPVTNPLNCHPVPPEEEQTAMPKLADRKGRYIPQPLADQRVNGTLPSSLPKSVMDQEGGTYNWLFKTLTRFAGIAPCKALGNNATWLQPVGFDVLKIIDIKEDLSSYGLSAKSLPMVAILRQKSAQVRSKGCRAYAAASAASSAGAASNNNSSSSRLCEGGHLLILVRGSLTSEERKLDFSYKMRRDASYGPGSIHRGFWSAASQLWAAGLKAVLDAEVVQANGLIRHITLAGHSLGAGVAALLAARTQNYLQPALRRQPAWRAWPNQQPLISAVLFAAPNAGDHVFVNSLNTRLNARNIAFANDLIPQVPCVPLSTACPNAAVPTGNSRGFWPYGRVGGNLRFTGADMPYQKDAWQAMKNYTQHIFCNNMLSINALNKAAHICSYLCWSSAFVNDAENWCLLWPAVGNEEQQAAYCMERSGRDPFPTNPLYPVKP